MAIKHLVLSGGGTIGLYYVGILKYLQEHSHWNRTDLCSVHATSIGAIIGTLLILIPEWSMFESYVVHRPWCELFDVSRIDFMGAYTMRGIFDVSYIERVFSPALLAADLSSDITLRELFEWSSVDLHVFSARVAETDPLAVVDISHATHGNMRLVDAIHMSCALPILFTPIADTANNAYYIDGGMGANYPIAHCTCIDTEATLGLRYVYNSALTTDTMSVLDYMNMLFSKIIQHINQLNMAQKASLPCVRYEIVHAISVDPMAIYRIMACITCSEERMRCVQEGYATALNWANQQGTSSSAK